MNQIECFDHSYKRSICIPIEEIISTTWLCVGIENDQHGSISNINVDSYLSICIVLESKIVLLKVLECHLVAYSHITIEMDRNLSGYTF